MSLSVRLRMIKETLERIASELPTEEMFMRFSEQVVDTLGSFIDEVEEAEG